MAMIQSFKQLKNLPVYTKSEEFLGKIKDVEINSDDHRVIKYVINSSDVIKRISGKELFIGPGQVISLDEQKMIVEDSTEKENKLIKEPALA